MVLIIAYIFLHGNLFLVKLLKSFQEIFRISSGFGVCFQW